MTRKEAYQLLQLPPGSSIQDVKESFAELVNLYHPEKHPLEFQQIYAAYKLLTGEQNIVIPETNSGENKPEEEFRKDRWDDLFGQMDQEYDAHQEELRREEQLRMEQQKQEEERKKQEQERKIQETLDGIRDNLKETPTRARRKRLKHLLSGAKKSGLLCVTQFMEGLKDLCMAYDVSFQTFKILLSAYDYFTTSQEEEFCRRNMRIFLLGKRANAPDERMPLSWKHLLVIFLIWFWMALSGGAFSSVRGISSTFLVGKPELPVRAFCSLALLAGYIALYRVLRRWKIRRWSTAHMLCSIPLLILSAACMQGEPSTGDVLSIMFVYSIPWFFLMLFIIIFRRGFRSI